MRKILAKIRDIKSRITSSAVKQPKEIKSMQTRIIAQHIVFMFLSNIFAFSMKGAQLTASTYPVIAVCLLVFYFSDRVIQSAAGTYFDMQGDNFSEIYSATITKIVLEMTSKARNKVKKKDPKSSLENMMSHPAIIKISKDYIDSVWNFWWCLPMTTARILILLVTIGITVAMELIEGSVCDTMFMMALLLICIIIYFILSKKRLRFMNKYRKVRKENETKQESLFAEINNIEFASDKDFRYHAGRLQEHLVSSKKLLKEERLKLNSVFIQRSLVASLFMIIILLYKLFTGGVINEQVILAVVAVSTVYSTILQNITEILKQFEKTMDYLIDIDKLSEDFDHIYEVYSEEISKTMLSDEEQSIVINRFQFSYDRKNIWKLVNDNAFSMKTGENVLVQGETGCGKSTFGLIIEGGVRLPVSPIGFSNGKRGYLKTLTYHTDRSMANNFILNEILLSDDTDSVDRPKLMEILEGLDLKRVFLELAKEGNMLYGGDDDELVIEFAKTRTYEQFSSGQKQRIALAKLLYTMDKDIQIIWLDEAFNRLNDQVADKCVSFILDYVQRDRKRLVLLATHQVDIIRPYCSKEISFERSLSGVSTLVVQQLDARD